MGTSSPISQPVYTKVHRAGLLTFSNLPNAPTVYLMARRADPEMEAFDVVREAQEDMSHFTVLFIHGEGGTLDEVRKIKILPDKVFVFGRQRVPVYRHLKAAFPFSHVKEGYTPEEALTSEE